MIFPPSLWPENSVSCLVHSERRRQVTMMIDLTSAPRGWCNVNVICQEERRERAVNNWDLSGKRGFTGR